MIVARPTAGTRRDFPRERVACRTLGADFGGGWGCGTTLQRCSPPSPRFRADDSHQGRSRRRRWPMPCAVWASIRPTPYPSSVPPTPITVTGPRRLRWPSPSRPAATPASWASSWSTRSTPHRRRTSRPSRSPVRASSTSGWPTPGSTTCSAEVIDEGVDGYAGPDLGHGAAGQRRVRQRQPHRAAPRRPRPLGVVRRRPVAGCFEPVRLPGRRASTTSTTAACRCRLFAESLAARKAGEEPPEDGYQGAYISEWAAEMPDDADPFEWGYQRVPGQSGRPLAAMGVEFDAWFSERSLVDSGAIEATLGDLRDRGVVYEDDGAAWLRTTDFGDDKDRVLVKLRRRRTPTSSPTSPTTATSSPGARPAHRRVGRRPPRLRVPA